VTAASLRRRIEKLERSEGAKAPSVATSTPQVAPAGTACPFPLGELLAIEHALQGAIPDSLYASWVSAARRTRKLIEEAQHGR
jgi:hypothetical protein